MKNKLAIVTVLGAALGVAACTSNSPGQHVTNLPPGTYKNTSQATDSSDTTTTDKTTTTVGYDANGNKQAVVKTDQTVQPPGITGYFNKTTNSSTQVYQQ